MAVNKDGSWSCKAWDWGKGQSVDQCKKASEDFFDTGETVQVVLVRAQIPMPTEYVEPENNDSCEVELGG